MNTRFASRVIVALLAVGIIAPAFLVPQRASAQVASAAGAASCFAAGGVGLAGGAASAVLSVPVNDMANLAQNTFTAGATQGDCIKNNIITPLARLMARIVIQQITASTINWITGRNGTGQPTFVTNLSLNLQAVGDAVALSYISRVTTAFNSPFGPMIAQSLQLQYNQQSSLAGFFAANQSTLNRWSPNPNAFLSGQWAQGGIPAWFALTTQTQNNPYTLYQAAEGQLRSNLSQAETNRRQDIAQGGGFLSWCGVTDAAAQDQSSAAGGGANPGDACTNSDGTPGTVQTPGSAIHDYAQKAIVGAGLDQLVSVTDIDQALGAIAMALVNQVLGNGGLLGAGTPLPGRPPITNQLQAYSGDTSANTGSSSSFAGAMLSRITAYKAAWGTITSSADVASSSLNRLVTYCNSQATDPNALQGVINANVAAAQAALATEVAPIYTQAGQAIAATDPTKALALKVQAESSSVTSTTTAATIAADTGVLATAAPTVSDLTSVQQNASVMNGAKANPAGSLTVAGGSLVDQMNLITTNAAALQAACTPNAANGPSVITPTG